MLYFNFGLVVFGFLWQYLLAFHLFSFPQMYYKNRLLVGVIVLLCVFFFFPPSFSLTRFLFEGQDCQQSVYFISLMCYGNEWHL